MKREMLVIAVGGGLLVGCATAPVYKEPVLPMPPQWSVPVEGGTSTGVTDLTYWWKELKDPTLDTLVEQALKVNLDIKIARARLREARANREMIAPERLPQVNLNVQGNRSRNSQNGGFNGGNFGGGATGAVTQALTGGNAGGFTQSMHNLFEAGFDAKWELDIFGQVEKELEAADASTAAAKETLRNAQVTLVSEVAREYLDVRGAQRRLEVARKNIATQKDSLSISQSRFDAGLSSELDVKQAQAQLASTEATVPSLETAVTAGILRLAILTRRPGEQLLAELNTGITWPQRPLDVPVGLPSDLLRRRPDVRGAERELAAATARAGVAVIDLYPKFSLTGRFGSQSSEVETLNLGASRFWSFGPGMSLPIFDRGKIKANIKAANARTDAALAQYERAVLVALDESQTALVSYSKEQARLESLRGAVDANVRALEIANELYRQGLADFLNVIQAQGALLAAQDAAIVSEETVLQQLVALYKAVGGGWAPEADGAEPATATATK